LQEAKYQILVYSNHESLKFFEHPRLLYRRQAEWAEKLMPYNYLIFYQKGSSNGNMDTLSCNPKYCLKKGGTTGDDNDLGNQFKFRVLDLVLANGTIATGENCRDDLGSITISSSEIYKPKAEYAKK
jgi:hypothetical protein